MISLILLFLAAMCNAIMDKSLFHWHKSILWKLELKYPRLFKREWWDGVISHLNKYTDRDFNKPFKRIKIWRWSIVKPVQLTDAFHWFKFLMLAFIIGSIVTYKPIIHRVVDFFILGSGWIFVFNGFYNNILAAEAKEN